MVRGMSRQGAGMVIVYVDLIFLLNAAIDGALLVVTAWTRNAAVRLWRIAAASVIGGAYVVMMLVPELSFMFTFLVKLLFSALMIVTAFGFGGMAPFLRNLTAFYVVSFAAAGGIFGFHYFFMASGDVWNGIFFAHSGGMLFEMNTGIWFVLAAFAIVMWIYLRVFRGAKQKERLVTYMAEVEVAVEDFVMRCKGLVDTGNQLYDPLTKTPVMVVETAMWKDVLPEKWVERIRKAEVDQIVSTIGSDEFCWQDRLRLVPYRGVNRGTQFMLAIKPDRVTVIYNDRKIDTHKVLVGFDAGKLCSDDSYHAIIHPMLLQT